jgi:hypothetical protein
MLILWFQGKHPCQEWNTQEEKENIDNIGYCVLFDGVCPIIYIIDFSGMSMVNTSPLLR